MHSPAVIGKAADIWSHSCHIRKPFAPLSAAYCSIGMNPNISRPFDYIKLYAERTEAIRHWGKIRHGADIGIAARSGCGRTACYAFLIKKSRFSKMNMNINETRNNYAI